MSLIKVYYSHSMCDYNTKHEERILNKVKKKFNDAEIINPKDIQSSKSSNIGSAFMILEKQFFSVIDKCNVLVYSLNKNDKLTYGVKKEVEYAKRIGIKVMEID